MTTSSSAPKPPVRSASEEAIFWAAVKDAVNRQYTDARARALAEMEVAGSLRQLVRSDDSVELGKLNTTDGHWSAEVHDEAALLAWVQDHRPGEWYQAAPPIKVREAFVDWCKQDAILSASAGSLPYARDGASGDPIPGIRAIWKEGTTTVTANTTAKGRAATFLEALFNQARGLPAPSEESDGPH